MTRRGRRQRDEEWTCKFSKLLRLVVESNNIKLDHLDSDAGILLSAFRTWVSGRNLPGPSYFNLLLSFITPRVSDSSGPIILERVFRTVPIRKHGMRLSRIPCLRGICSDIFLRC